MTAFAGREVIINIDNKRVAGIVSRTINNSKTELDITTDTSGGLRDLLKSSHGVKSFDLSVNGVMDKANFEDLFLKYNSRIKRPFNIN